LKNNSRNAGGLSTSTSSRLKINRSLMKQMRIILAGMRLLLLKKIHICQLKKSLKGMRIKKMITLLRSKN